VVKVSEYLQNWERNHFRACYSDINYRELLFIFSLCREPIDFHCMIISLNLNYVLFIKHVLIMKDNEFM
jgi:hypothetical protein